MQNKIIQDWDDLAKAVFQVRAFLEQVSKSCVFAIGDVVKTEDGLVGVVTGVDAPQSPDEPWSYSVCTPDTEHLSETEDCWYDADQLERIQWSDENPYTSTSK